MWNSFLLSSVSLLLLQQCNQAARTHSWPPWSSRTPWDRVTLFQHGPRSLTEFPMDQTLLTATEFQGAAMFMYGTKWSVDQPEQVWACHLMALMALLLCTLWHLLYEYHSLVEVSRSQGGRGKLGLAHSELGILGTRRQRVPSKLYSGPCRKEASVPFLAPRCCPNIFVCTPSALSNASGDPCLHCHSPYLFRFLDRTVWQRFYLSCGEIIPVICL